jgi:hypothetical protein
LFSFLEPATSCAWVSAGPVDGAPDPEAPGEPELLQAAAAMISEAATATDAAGLDQRSASMFFLLWKMVNLL